MLKSLFVCAAAVAISAQELPRDFGNWRVTYTVDGGIAGHHHAVSVSRDGQLTVEDNGLGDTIAAGASQAQLTKLGALLSTAKPARKEKPKPFPDMVFTSLSVTSGGRTYELDPAEDLVAALENAANSAVADAVIGSWQQAGWALCKPAAQLTADDYDTPIDALEMRKDGTFEITWAAGGAHTSGPPHVLVPDVSGHYKVYPQYGTMEFTMENGLVHPRDVSGRGSFRLRGGQLTLSGVWFGTRTARHKPDICELTFARRR